MKKDKNGFEFVFEGCTQDMCDANNQKCMVCPCSKVQQESFTKLEVSLMTECLIESRDSIQEKLDNGMYMDYNIEEMQEMLDEHNALIEKSNRIWRSMKVEEDK